MFVIRNRVETSNVIITLQQDFDLSTVPTAPVCVPGVVLPEMNKESSKTEGQD